MIVELHEFVDDDSFAMVWHRKLGEVSISVEIQSGESAMTNLDVQNFRHAVRVISDLVQVGHE